MAFGTEAGGASKALAMDTVFSIFSVTKAMTNVLVFRAIELGQLALTTKVSSVIPEFSGGLRQHLTVFDLLTHASGLPSVFTPQPGMNIDKLDEIIAAIVRNVHSSEQPGVRVDYSPIAHHALYGTLSSPETFGNYGAGTSLFWVDPVREITFAFLSSGVMNSAENIERFQRISDVVISAAI